MKKLEVSIVMAEYNTHEQDLREAIQSILDQTFKNFEFIIVDDGTTTNLEKIVNEFNDSRIIIVKNPRNMGFVYSLNNGIKQAKGEYIVRMDTDDISLPDRVEKIYNFIKKNPEYDVVGTKAVEFSGDREFGVLGKAGEKTKKTILHGDMLIHASVIMKKSALQAVGGYRNYRRAEDLSLWCELLLTGHRLATINETSYRYRVNAQDYQKRRLKHRKDEIKARLHYYPRLGAGVFDYLFIVKSILSGVMPTRFVQLYRNTIVLNKKSGPQ